MDEATDSRPQALAPADEAMLARARTLSEIADAVLRDVTQHYPPGDHGAVLRDALFVQDLAARLIDQAVVVERERGASWADIGEAAGSSRQSAHERWSDHVRGWVATGRRRTGINTGPADPADLAHNLDRWYADLARDDTDAISRTLPSLHDGAARAEAAQHHAEVEQLHRRTEELRAAIDTAYIAAMEATGTPAAAEKRALWSAHHAARADVYDRLAVLEAPIAPEHRRSATAQRNLARDVMRNRRDGILAAERTTEDGDQEMQRLAQQSRTPHPSETGGGA